MNKDLGASAKAEPGSRASTEPGSTVSALTGFDPARMEERLSELLALEHNWNSYRALPVDTACADRVRRFYPVMETLGLQPWITPGVDGGLTIERGGIDDYSVEFDPKGSACVYFDGLSDTDAWALIGLFAQLKALDAIATEAATAAETVQLGSVHEGAGRNGIAQGPSA